MTKGERKDRFLGVMLPIISILAFLLIWQVVVVTGIVPEKKLPLPVTVFESFLSKLTHTEPDGATLITNIQVSLTLSLTGLILGIVIGTPLGWLMGWYKAVNALVKPVFELIRPIPPISWIPLMIVWVGVGMESKVVIIFFSAFIPCVLNSYSGICQTSQVLINLAKTYGASNFETFYKVGIPSALPMSFAGMRIALGNAWSTLVAAELLAANAGLGYMITMGRSFQRADIIIVGMLTIGILGYIMTTIFGILEKRIVKGRGHNG